MKVSAIATVLSAALMQTVYASPMNYESSEFNSTEEVVETIYPRATDTYVTFFSDNKCNNKVGSVSYDVTNTGCFSNSGSFVKPHCGPGGCAQQVFRMIKSPGDPGQCNCQIQCFGFKGWHTGWCYNVGSLGTNWRMESDTATCGPNNC